MYRILLFLQMLYHARSLEWQTFILVLYVLEVAAS